MDVTHEKYCPAVERHARQFRFQPDPKSSACSKEMSSHQREWNTFGAEFVKLCREYQKNRPAPGAIGRIVNAETKTTHGEAKKMLHDMGTEFHGTAAQLNKVAGGHVTKIQSRIREEVVSPFDKTVARLEEQGEKYDKLLQAFPACAQSKDAPDVNRRMRNFVREFYAERFKELQGGIKGDYALLATEMRQAEAGGIQVGGLRLEADQKGAGMRSMTGVSAQSGGSAAQAVGASRAPSSLAGVEAGSKVPPEVLKSRQESESQNSERMTKASASPTPSATSAAESILGDLEVNNGRAGSTVIAEDAARLIQAEGSAGDALVKVMQARNYDGVGGDNTLATRMYVESVLQRPVSDDDLKMLDRYLFAREHPLAATVATVPYEGMKYFCQNVMGGTDVVGYWAKKVGSSVTCTGSRFQGQAISETFKGAAGNIYGLSQ